MLDDYSTSQQAKLATLRPDWQPYVSEYPYENGVESYLLVAIPSPGNPDTKLYLYTAGEEVTIAFGVWEWHYPDPSTHDVDELESALEVVSNIQSDERLIVSYWLKDKWLGSRIISVDDPLVVAGFAEEARLARVLSWSGRHNREAAL